MRGKPSEMDEPENYFLVNLSYLSKVRVGINTLNIRQRLGLA